MATAKEKTSALTAEWLRSQMSYDCETGIFRWTARGYGRTVGKQLGTMVWPGYIHIKVAGVLYKAHRLAWFYVHGEWPNGVIDHIDCKKNNNAISNLRVCTSAQNAARRETGWRRIAPARGVTPHGPGFVVRIRFAGKRHYLGYFSSLAAAKAAYAAKAREIHGDFAHRETVTAQDAAVADATLRGPHRDWLLVATPGFGV